MSWCIKLRGDEEEEESLQPVREAVGTWGVVRLRSCTAGVWWREKGGFPLPSVYYRERGRLVTCVLCGRQVLYWAGELLHMLLMYIENRRSSW